MGWTGVYERPENNLKGMEKFFKRQFEFEKDGRKLEIVDVGKYGKEVYLACHFTDLNKNINETYAMVVLTSFEGGMFHYKEMSENAGPCAYNCPKKILDKLTSTTDKYAIGWRQKNYETHEKKKNIARRKKDLKCGMILKFKEPIKFQGGDELDTLTLIDKGKSLFRHNLDYYRVRGFMDMEFEIVA
ncbi:DUF6927 domain-containing protein [Alkaliphilus sp. B6464]|uniref:DUF6927 domain-containing protein n=1 Tax=Alkaliphilus sp. B6464 TaxID=2731219 RepID=UPI001BA5479E|nr:hypothetical protein [Alkaliphilus sp. B6464]QUH21746.1 hypothetical protein HYG84_17575 [Alkaliphilus sp. B6464]